MAFKKTTAGASAPDSPDLLFRDLPRRKFGSLFEHQAQILRSYRSKALSSPDVALQLPTGSGKTLVGLLLAEWRRRRNQERVVYLCPTRQLVGQVAEEARKNYGITVETFTGRAKDYTPEAKAAYTNADRVAVTTYSSLFNTNPFFADPEVVIVDDAHVAENYIANQWSMRIAASEDGGTLFRAVASVLKPSMDGESYARLLGESKNFDELVWVDKLPTHLLMESLDELRTTIDFCIGDQGQKFAWRMLADHLYACQIYMAASEILIRPLVAPTWTHAPFADATQRVYMSATLGAGGDLERLTGRSKIVRLPIPDGWDRQGIGRRLFLFPEMSMEEGDVALLRHRLMRVAGRSLVLTTSDREGDKVKADVRRVLGFKVVDASDLEDGRASFTDEAEAVAVVANRYDGIDFPGDACRLLFVEGLPRASNLQERFLMGRMGANVLFNERVQTRVLQAVGRCTRALNDFSAVVVTGVHLPAYLTDRKRRSHLHPELQAELAFGIEQSKDVQADDIVDNFEIFLANEADWEDANEGILQRRGEAIQLPFPAMDNLAAAAPLEIAWQRAMWDKDHASAFESAREILGVLKAAELRGYRALWHYLAGSAAEQAAASGDRALGEHARTQFKRAKEAASGIPWLTSLARGRGAPTTSEAREDTRTMLQVERLEGYLDGLGTVHNRAYSEREDEIRKGLADGKRFERAQVMLGEHLGFAAGKREDDASPDPWWMIADTVFVFEDHANARDGNSVIDATKARQAASHPDWIREHVPGAARAEIQSVLVTPATKAKAGAVPHLGRVSLWPLAEFREWAEQALVAIRELRRTFVEPGDLAWRAEAATALLEARADVDGLSAWLTTRRARDHLTPVQ